MMRLLLLSCLTASPTVAFGAVDYGPLAGEWTVDLRLKLDDPVYTQAMKLTIAADKTITGSFYNSDILAGKAGTAQGRSCVSFRTTDGNGLYHSSACLVDGKMVGTTWAEGRGFVLPWTAERTKK